MQEEALGFFLLQTTSARGCNLHNLRKSLFDLNPTYICGGRKMETDENLFTDQRQAEETNFSRKPSF